MQFIMIKARARRINSIKCKRTKRRWRLLLFSFLSFFFFFFFFFSLQQLFFARLLSIRHIRALKKKQTFVFAFEKRKKVDWVFTSARFDCPTTHESEGRCWFVESIDQRKFLPCPNQMQFSRIPFSLLSARFRSDCCHCHVRDLYLLRFLRLLFQALHVIIIITCRIDSRGQTDSLFEWMLIIFILVIAAGNSQSVSQSGWGEISHPKSFISFLYV